MQNRTIYITKYDLERLEELIEVAGEFNYRDRNDLRELEEEIHNCVLVDAQDIPPNVVTMNSRVQLVDADSNQSLVYTLVFPGQADIGAGKLSIVSPIGTAILGYSEGDVIQWKVPAGLRRLRIEKVLYQPEAAKDFHL